MQSTFIIAEAGVNHNGDINLAFELVEKAKEAGADCVKFQTFVTDEETSKNAEKAEYQKITSGSTETQYEMSKRLELSFEQFIEIKKHCDRIGITFLSTAFDFSSIKFLNKIEMPFWKIPSSEVTNLPYLEEIGKTKKSVVLSTGMSSMQEIDDAIEILRKSGTPSITLLHCTTEYPAPLDEVNLNAMITLKNYFNVEVGYSDHTDGIAVPIAAVALGASIIEKHFTLDKSLPGPDHKASLNPKELKLMIEEIRKVELSLGDGIKTPTPSELKNMKVARKSIVAKTRINKGDLFTVNNITVKRPGTGISPMRWYQILGMRALRNFDEDEEISI